MFYVIAIKTVSKVDYNKKEFITFKTRSLFTTTTRLNFSSPRHKVLSINTPSVTTTKMP